MCIARSVRSWRSAAPANARTKRFAALLVQLGIPPQCAHELAGSLHDETTIRDVGVTSRLVVVAADPVDGTRTVVHG